MTFLCWPLPQGAPASRATLGCGMQPLRGKEHTVAAQESANLELLSLTKHLSGAALAAGSSNEIRKTRLSLEFT